MKRCPYCMVEHNRKGAVYCSTWCARKGAAHNAAASRERNRVFAKLQAVTQERIRWSSAWRQISMGNDSALSAIFDPQSRARRRKRIRTGK